MALYIVATPIGNMEDITLRALRLLRDVSLILAEDTRHTRQLLSRHGIETPVSSFHDHNERQKVDEVVRRLREGEEMALVTDAGTPAHLRPRLCARAGCGRGRRFGRTCAGRQRGAGLSERGGAACRPLDLRWLCASRGWGAEHSSGLVADSLRYLGLL